WPAGLRAVRLAMAPSRAVSGTSARSPNQARDAERPSNAGRRDTRSAASTTRANSWTVCLCHRARWSYGAEKLPHPHPPPGRAGENAVRDPPAYAAPRLRLRAGERRTRHASTTGMAWPPQYPAHGALHGISAEPISRFLARLKTYFGMSAYRGEPDFAVAAR